MKQRLSIVVETDVAGDSERELVETQKALMSVAVALETAEEALAKKR